MYTGIFSDWARIRRDYTAWWDGALDRAIVPIMIRRDCVERPCPDVPLLNQQSCHMLDIPAERVIDRIDWELRSYEYLGDAFPVITFESFGPGVLSVFCGAILSNITGNVWFHAPRKTPIEELTIALDEDNPYLRRIIDLCRAGAERWQGEVLVGMADLGGVMDVLSTFLPGEELLYALYDAPEHVHRLENEIMKAWFRAYELIREAAGAHSPGYCDWARLYSPTPYYTLQSDFSYMISPDMFKEFVLPRLKAYAERMDHAMYHLDGAGQLAHLDMILSVDSIQAVQWVPGAGAKPPKDWPEVFERVFAAGKRAQFIDDAFTGLPSSIAARPRCRDTYCHIIFGTPDTRDELMRKRDALLA